MEREIYRDKMGPPPWWYSCRLIFTKKTKTKTTTTTTTTTTKTWLHYRLTSIKYLRTSHDVFRRSVSKKLQITLNTANFRFAGEFMKKAQNVFSLLTRFLPNRNTAYREIEILGYRGFINPNVCETC